MRAHSAHTGYEVVRPGLLATWCSFQVDFLGPTNRYDLLGSDVVFNVRLLSESQVGKTSITLHRQ